MKKLLSRCSRFPQVACGLLAAGFLAPAAQAQFTPTGAGPWDYTNAGYWTGGTINGVFSQTPTVGQNQTVTFGANSSLMTGLTFSLGGSGNLITLRGTGTERTVTLGGDVSVSSIQSTVVLGSATAGQGLNVVLGADRTFAVTPGNQLMVSNVVSGGNALTKTGAGSLILGGANTYTGATTVNEGPLFLNASGALALGNNVVINATATSTANPAANLTLSAGFTQTIGTLTFGGAGSTASSINQVTLYQGSTLTLGGTVTVLGTGDHKPNWSIFGEGTLALGANRTFDIADSSGTNSELNIYSPISGAGLSLTKTGAGRLALNSPGTTYDGGTIINGGELYLNASNTLAAAGAVTVNNTVGATSMVILGKNYIQTIGALTFGGTGGGGGAVNEFILDFGTLMLGGTVTYDATNNSRSFIRGSGTLALAGNRTFNIGDSSNQTVELEVAAVISGQGNSLTKTGAGALRLVGANTYSGGTIVSAGGLVVGTTTGSGVGTGALRIQSGAFLRGAGFVGGATTIESGGVLGTGGTGGVAGNLRFTNGLTLNDGAVFNFQLGSTSDRFTLTSGVLTGAAAPGSLTLNLTAGADFGAGVYTLFDFSTGGVTTSSFDVEDFVLGTTIGGYTYSLASAGNQLQLSASAIPEPSTYAAIAGAAMLGLAVWRRAKRTRPAEAGPAVANV